MAASRNFPIAARLDLSRLSYCPRPERRYSRLALGAVLAGDIGRGTFPVPVVGVVSHGWGMLQKHRLESGSNEWPPWWESTLYWGCWAALAAPFR
jgi:hypothetical protein